MKNKTLLRSLAALAMLQSSLLLAADAGAKDGKDARCFEEMGPPTCMWADVGLHKVGNDYCGTPIIHSGTDITLTHQGREYKLYMYYSDVYFCFIPPYSY